MPHRPRAGEGSVGDRASAASPTARMDRPDTHDLPKAQVLARLRALALNVEEMEGSARYDFLVNGQVRLALRAAFPSAYRRRVRVASRLYNYVYRAWNFNFHHRGRIDERYCDFQICVPLGSRRRNLDTAYVIPWEARSGKTFYLPDSQRPYAGKYAVYRDAWEQLRESCAALP